MKICPACQTQYTDDTLQFCLQDGTPLGFARQLDAQTVVKNQSPTWQPSQATHFAQTRGQRTGSKTTVVVITTVLVMLVLFGAAGIGALLYFRSPGAEPVSNATPRPSQTANASTRPTLTPQTSPSPQQNVNTSLPSNKADDAEAQDEVSERLISWKASAEALDLDGNISHYAGIVDYYNRNGASVAVVRADKLRAFTRYDSINIKLTNISISVDADGQAASVTLDKEWNFEGIKDSSGKVKQLVKLNKINGQWLITAEKDLKVYFTR